MALFQDEQITEEQFNNKYNLNKEPDTFSNLGYDDIIKERQEIRNKRIEEESQWVKNLVSPDKIQDWKNQGQMSAIQVWHKKNKNELMPYMGTWKQGTKAFNIKDISDKLQTGQVVTPDERKQFEDFVLDLAEIQTRGYTFGGQATNIGLETIPFMAEFALGLLTTGGTSSFGATTSKLSTELMKKGLTRQIGEGIAKTAFNASINPKTYAFTATRLPQQVRARMGDIMLSDSLAITPEGQTILKESEERPAIAFMKALALTNIETASEMSGEMLVRPFLKAGGKLGKVIASPVLKQLPEEFTNKFVKLAETVTKMPFLEGVRTFGFDGMLEEMGEERVGDLLKFAFNLDGEEGYSFEQLLDAMFPNISQGIGETLKQLGAEALSFGMTGMGMHAMHNTLKALPKVGDKYSKDGFLVDAGIFRIAGYDSYLDKTIKDKLVKEGKTEEEIDNVLDFSTRDDKIQYLKESKTEFDSKKEYDEKEFEKDLKRAEVEDKTYEKLIKGGVSQDVAYANAKLFGQFFRKFGSDNQKEFDEWYDKFDVQYNVPAEKQTLFQAILSDVDKNKKVDVVDLSAQFSDAKNLTKDDLTEHIKNLVGTKNISSKDKKAIFNFVARSKRIGKKDVLIPSHIANSSKVEKKLKEERNTSVKNITDLLGNSILIEKTENKDKHTKPNVDNYLRFYVPVKINKNVFTVRIIAENNENKNLFNILNADVYDVIIDKKMMARSTSPDKQGNLGEPSNNSINDNTEDFNPDELTIEEMLKGVKDAEGNVYFQSAYHGSPFKIKKISNKHVGKGEGATAHGWGSYVASDIETGWEYRNRLNRNKNNDEAKINGIGISKIYDELERSSIRIKDNKEAQKVYNKMAIIEELMLNKSPEEIIENFGDDEYMAEAINWFKDEVIPNLKYSGTLLQLDIPEDSEMLNEDLTFDEQPENVKNALKRIVSDYSSKHFLGDFEDAIYKNATGRELYATLANDIQALNKDYSIPKLTEENNQIDYDSRYEYASKMLDKYGVKGIKYDGEVDGICYVIFNDKNLKTLKTYYQEENPENEKLIAGYTYIEVMDKLTELYEKLGNDENLSKEESDKLMTKTHVLEDAFEVSEHPDKFSNEDKRHEIMLNAFYIMNNQEIPEKYVEADAVSQRTYRDYVELHKKKKDEMESKYYGYFTEGQDKNIITIMQNSNPSTALHELGHLFLNGLNELARANKDAQKQLEAVNKWLGSTGEYTVAQQEKFARSFEAYLYKGKAPNNYLRQVFENFKEWLKSVYSEITNLENKGADISPEVQEMFDNMFSGDEYYQQKKEASRLLSKVRLLAKKEKFSNIPVRDDNSLTEGQKRHKQVSYEILSIATGKDINYLKRIFETSSTKNGYGRRREVVEELLEQVDDKITVQGGMHQEWMEFYSDTGVNYDTQDSGGDYKLAEQALRTILNKDYYDPEQILNDKLTDEAEYYEKAIDDAERQYNVLLRNFKKGNRNVVLSAIYEWIEQLPSAIREDYENKFIFDSGIIDREENIDKFDKAKREIIARAMELDSSNGIKTINDNEKYKEIVQQIIRSLDFLNPFDKAKLTANILDVPTTSFLMARIDSILDIAKTMEDVSLRRNLEREIHKELQGTKNVRKNGRSVGKYDYRTNKIFEELRTLDRLSPEKANEMRLESSKFATAEDNGLSFKDKLVNKFLSYKAGGRTFADTELMKSLYDEITRIKLAGKTAKSEMELMDGLTEEQDIEELINIVNAKKDASIGTKIHLESIGNLESMLNAIFGKDIKERYATEILYAETQAQTFEYEQKKKLEEGIAKIYNLPKWDWDKQIIKYLGQEYKYPEIRRKYDEQGEIVKTRMIDRTLTKMDIIQAYIWSKNEILEKRLMNQFGEDTLYSMFEELSKEDEQLAQLLMDTAQSFYPLVNKAFIEKYGLDLPKVSCYFPSTPERGSEVDLYNEYSSKSLGNGFTKARANSETQAMDFHNPVATLYSHIDGVAKFCFMSNILDKSNIRFRDKDLKRAIVNKYGDGVFKVLENMLMSITYKSEGKINNAIEKIIDGMTSNWTVANIAGKLSIAFKQFISANNYALDMPSAEWFAGFTKSILDSSNTIKYMWNIPYVRARFGGSYSSEYLKQSIGNKLFTKTTKLKDALTIFLRLGDAGSLVFGGKPYIDYLINTKGMSEEQAIKQFIIQTNRYQQSSATTSLGMLQINASKQGWARPFTTYKNQQFQYLRGAIDSLYSCMNGDISKTECAKTIFHNIFLQPFIFNLATSGSLIRLAMTGDDDDLIADLRDSIFNLGTDAIAGLDIIWKAVIQKAFGEKNVRIATIPMWGDIQKEIFKLFKKDAELGDILHSAGYLFGNIATGIPINTVVSESKGIGTMLSDDVLKGLLMISGISEKTAGHMTGKEKK